jgi:hypothetical protein
MQVFGMNRCQGRYLQGKLLVQFLQTKIRQCGTTTQVQHQNSWTAIEWERGIILDGQTRDKRSLRGVRAFVRTMPPQTKAIHL